MTILKRDPDIAGNCSFDACIDEDDNLIITTIFDDSTDTIDTVFDAKEAASLYELLKNHYEAS